MSLKFKCPDCSEAIVSKFCKVGEVVKCKKCGAEFAIPETAQQIDEESTLIDKTVAISEEKVERINDIEYQIARGKRYPGILQAIWLIILLFLLLIVVGIPVRIVGSVMNLDPLDVAVVRGLISSGIILMYAFSKTKALFREVFSFRSFHVSYLFPMFLTIIGLSIISSEIDNLFRIIFPMPAEVVDIFIDIAWARLGLWRSILYVAILAPLIEELLFRGLILRGFLNRYTVRKAVIVSAIFFGGAHGNPWQFFSAFTGGIVLAWWFVNTRSLFPCLFGHAMSNLLPIIFMAILHVEIRGYTSGLTQTPQFQPIWLDMLGLVLFVLGIWLSARMFRKINSRVGGVQK